MRLLLAFLFTLSAVSLAAAAEVKTYKGTLGKLPVIVELSEPVGKKAMVAGRYAYMSKGIDIPLRGTQAADGTASLIEEKACTPETCLAPDGDLVLDPPVGADWTLSTADAGKTLSGTWKDRASGKTLAVTLTATGGSRSVFSEDDISPFQLDPYDVVNANWVDGNPPLLKPADSPYDFLKLDSPLTFGPETALGMGAYKMGTDPRIGMFYPVVTRIDGVADLAPLDAFLAQQRLQWNLYAYSCKSKAYLGLGWMNDPITDDSGLDGGGNVEVTYLTDRLMGYFEAGSYFCGGAHPDNFLTQRLVDVKTGERVVAERMLKGWVERDFDGNVLGPDSGVSPGDIVWGPNPELVSFVNARRKKLDDQMEADCDIDGLVNSNLGIYFRDDKLVFTLKDLEHVRFACGDDLLEIPIREAKPLLTEAALARFSQFD